MGTAPKLILPLPEIYDQNLSHSFKNLNKTNPTKKPPKLYPKSDFSFSRNVSSLAHAISFKNCMNDTVLGSLYRKDQSDSYFQQCFEKISKIGEGSFGEVYKVRSKEDGLMYAVKKTKQYFRGESYREERLEEVKRYEEFSEHEHCVTLYRAWEQDDRLFMQMELCKGSLESYVSENKFIPESTVWSILLDLLLALKSLHDKNLIHLDIKLDNILITDDEVCKLGDFGLVLDLGRGNLKSATEGDSRYIAPEILQGKFTKAADIFSLGITVLELACNLELPSNGELWQQLRSNIFPVETNKIVSPELFSIIKLMMSSDVNKRPTVDTLLRHPRLERMLKQRSKWYNLKRLKQYKRNSILYLWRKWCNLKQILMNYIWSIMACLSLRHPKNDATELERDSLSHLEFSNEGTPLVDDRSINMEEAINSTPLNHYGMNFRKSRFLSPSDNLSFSNYSNSRLSQSPFNLSVSPVHDHSSFTCKKLFTVEDSD